MTPFRPRRRSDEEPASRVNRNPLGRFPSVQLANRQYCWRRRYVPRRSGRRGPLRFSVFHWRVVLSRPGGRQGGFGSLVGAHGMLRSPGRRSTRLLGGSVPLTAGTILGSYEILAPLGAGGMGEVYRARDLRLKRQVAVKVLPEGLGGDPQALARLEREARSLAALSHPNLLALFDVGRTGGTAFAVLELLEGETLRSRLASGALPPRKALEIALQIVRGLAAAHARGIVHRDLKPENLFLTRDGHLKILDFGLARSAPAVDPAEQETAGLGPKPEAATTRDLPGSDGLTEPGMVLGTAGYMSPEQVRGKGADFRSDLFALGAILYE